MKLVPVSDGFTIKENIFALPLAFLQSGRPNWADDELRMESPSVHNQLPAWFFNIGGK